MDVNGSVTANGAIYTTKGGADICSSNKTGKYVQQGDPGTATATYQYNANGNKEVTIPITAAKLHNADGTYTETANANAHDTFTYCKGQECGGGTWVPNLKVAAIGATEYDTLQKAVTEFQKTSSSNTYIKMLHSTTEEITASRDLYLDLNGCTVTGDFKMAGHTLYGMDSTTDNYDGTTPGKLVGTVTGTVAPVHETSAKTVAGYDSLRYVAIKNEAGKEYTFHRFNISVTGYRFELKAPQCALFFRGEFRGDDEAKKHLESLGFTLTYENDTPPDTVSYQIPKDKESIPKMPADGKESTSEVVRDTADAYLFEACLMCDINKENYRTQFTATAQATFDNGGKQSDPRSLSFEDALRNPGTISGDQETIIDNFLKQLGITNP